MPYKKISAIIALSLAACVIVFLSLFASLPYIVEKQLEKRLLPLSGIGPIEFKIVKIGFFNTYVSGIRINEGISIDGVNIGYDLKGFLGFNLKKIIVSGLSINASLDKDNKITISGLKLPDPKDSKSKNKEPMDLSFLTYLPQKIVLNNARIFLDAKGQTFLIPLRALATINTKKDKIKIQAALYPFGEKVDALIAGDIENGIEQVEIESSSFDSDYLNPFFSQLKNKSRLDGPMDFSISSSRPSKKWDFSVSRVGVSSPFALEAVNIQAALLLFDHGISLKGSLNLHHEILPLIPVNYSAKLDFKDELNFEASLKTSEIKELGLTQKFTKIDIKSPEMSIFLSGTPDLFRGKIDFNARAANVKSGESRVKMSGISFMLPYNYPVQNAKGSFRVSNISYDDKYNFSARGDVFHSGAQEFMVKGSAGFDMLNDASLSFKALAGFEKELSASMNFNVDSFKITEAEIEKLAPQVFQNTQMDIMVSAKGSAKLQKNKLKSAMQVDLKDGNINIADTNLTIKGINTTIDLSDLMAPHSVPGQMLTVDSIQVNKVKIDDARVRFTIENTKSLLVENTKFKWCNGLVTTEAIRFPQKTGTYALSLYCDRLELTQLLEQAGAFDADGSGTLNGRIPIVYSNGNLSFDDGFLFSTPGSGGRIAVENTDVLTAGIPMDSPQFAELDVAREALKDFHYKWAKLVFNTFEDTLYLNMELDGKPSNIMPFEYKREIGRFVRVDASSPGSHFQGIKLDVNLNLPFNQVMKFGNKLQSILK